MKRFRIEQTSVAEVEVPDHVTEETIDDYLSDTAEDFPEKMEVDSTTYTEIPVDGPTDPVKSFADFPIGSKVVPHAKSIGGPLSESVEWTRARIQGQPFLFVVGVDNVTESALVCGVANNPRYGGDFFLPKDLDLYVEKEPTR
jgi:hypothetical protein